MKAPVDEHEWIDYRGETHNHKWLDYQGRAYIFKTSLGDLEEYNVISFQYNGIMCQQANINNNVVNIFKSPVEWFDPEWWYKMTGWGNNYPEEIYFKNGEFDIDYDNWDQINKQASKYAIPSSDIIDYIIARVHLGTNKKYEFPFDNTDYGEHWWEAYVPLELNGEDYLLTWQNCD